MLTTVAERKRPVGRKNPRVTVEVYDAERDLVRRVKVAAAAEGVTLREWTIEAWRRRLIDETGRDD